MIKDRDYQVARYDANQMYFHFRDILDYSQILSRSLLIFPQLCSLQEIIMHAIDLHKVKANEKKLDLSLDKYSKQWSLQVATDPDRFMQVLYILLSNAIKFTYKGGVTISY